MKRLSTIFLSTALAASAIACGDNGDTPTAADAAPTPPPIECENPPPQLMVVLDRSGSFARRPDGTLPPNTDAGKAETRWHIMLQAIRDFYFATGTKIGMKPAGGIANSKLAIHYLVMLQETLGKDWMNPELFRFGASKLANDVLMQIVKQQTGSYQSLDYFSND